MTTHGSSEYGTWGFNCGRFLSYHQRQTCVIAGTPHPFQFAAQMRFFRASIGLYFNHRYREWEKTLYWVKWVPIKEWPYDGITRAYVALSCWKFTIKLMWRPIWTADLLMGRFNRI